MRTLIVYFSKFGSTNRIAQAIAETLKQAGDIRVIGIDQLTASHSAGVRPGRSEQPRLSQRHVMLRFLAAATSSGRETGVVTGAAFSFSGSFSAH
jgi:hypothetical protein